MRKDEPAPTPDRLVDHLLAARGHASPALRRSVMRGARLGPDALDALVTKVALSPTAVTDDDVAAVLGAGLTEEQVFELVVCAAVGQAARQHAAGLAALAAAAPTER
jgi:alkylhydroperoxidase family enzyme